MRDKENSRIQKWKGLRDRQTNIHTDGQRGGEVVVQIKRNNSFSIDNDDWMPVFGPVLVSLLKYRKRMIFKSQFR